MLLDIEGVINWVKEKGYQELILEGHGYGCNKVLYYYTKNGKIATETYYYDFLPGGEENLIRYMGGKNGKSKVLNNIDIPVLIVFGDVDECVLTQPIDVVKEYLKTSRNSSGDRVKDGFEMFL